MLLPMLLHFCSTDSGGGSSSFAANIVWEKGYWATTAKLLQSICSLGGRYVKSSSPQSEALLLLFTFVIFNITIHPARNNKKSHSVWKSPKKSHLRILSRVKANYILLFSKDLTKEKYWNETFMVNFKHCENVSECSILLSQQSLSLVNHTSFTFWFLLEFDQIAFWQKL